jgi:Transcription factor WhiB
MTEVDLDYLYAKVKDNYHNPFRLQAVCFGTDTEIFIDETRQEEARAICETCPVKLQCLDNSLEFDDEFFRYLSPKE